ncbi:MAG: hypothetical protein QG635_602 [Bacteroidota bacterium]|nr:hypothetical protein [Bacteroidota bacterium]
MKTVLFLIIILLILYLMSCQENGINNEYSNQLKIGLEANGTCSGSQFIIQDIFKSYDLISVKLQIKDDTKGDTIYLKIFNENSDLMYYESELTNNRHFYNFSKFTSCQGKFTAEIWLHTVMPYYIKLIDTANFIVIN